MKIRDVKLPINRLIPFPFNPPIRLSDNTLRQLMFDIKTYGIVEQIIVFPKDEHYMLLNGHRRVLVCKELNYETMRCGLIEDYSGDYTDIYIALNRQLKVNGNQRLYFMKKTNKYFSENEKKKYLFLVNIGGTEIIDLMISKGNNTNDTYNWMIKISGYLKKTMKDDMAKILFWLVDLKRQYDSRQGIERKISPKLWWDLILKHEKLKGNIYN